jgi:hypothetical protein
MKLLFHLISVFMCLSVSDADIPEGIIAAVKQGNATEIVKFFDEKVSVKLIHQEDVLSKGQAEANIKYFFEKHAVKTFSSTHVSAMNNNSQYVTGTLETNNGKYRLSILLRKNLVSQFRIESDNE